MPRQKKDLITKTRIRMNNSGALEVYCTFCCEWKHQSNFSWNKQSNHYSSNCKSCRNESAKRVRAEKPKPEKPFVDNSPAWDKFWFRIEETEDNLEATKNVLKILGYDTTKNIYEQFIKKYKNQLDEPK